MHLIRRAGNAARRAGLRGKAAEAYQDALGVATLHGHITRAIHFAHRALHIYPVHHARLPAFSHDFAFLLVTRGLYTSALSILPLALRHIHRPTERLVALGTLARAAGGAQKPGAFWDALDEIRQLAFTHPSTGVGAMYSAGEGARLMGRWDDAAHLTAEALEMARANDDPVIWQLATELAADVRDRIAGIESCPEDDAEGRYLRSLSAELYLRLSRWRGPTWRPAHAQLPREDD
jgi:tetratricopeptide (TPR) repeat protein